MANIKISELVSGPITESSAIPASEGGSTVQVTPTQIARAALVSVNNQSSDYSFQDSDTGNIVVSTSSSDVDFTLSDSSSFLVGRIIELVQEGSGNVTLVEGAGTTINRSRFATLSLGGQGSTVRLRKQSSGNWIVSGDLKEKKPVLNYRLNQTPTADDVEFQISNVVAQGGFSSSFTTTDFSMPLSGLYAITFNASLRWDDTGDEEFMTIQILRKNLASAGYSKIGEQQLYKPTSAPVSGEFPINYSLVAPFAAGQEFRIVPSSTGGSCTPDTNSNERNECSIQWISD
jgi:hypothetical protein